MSCFEKAAQPRLFLPSPPAPLPKRGEGSETFAARIKLSPLALRL